MAGQLVAEEVTELSVTMEGVVTTVPEQLTQYCMEKSGIQCQDETVHKLMSLAAQRFLEGLIRDALKIHKRSIGSKPTQKGKDAATQDKAVLSSEDLAAALQEYGMHLGHQQYFADDLPALRPSTTITR